ncbi:hypothetical protein X947_3063 [Burkholderia pseudomallei MSHR7334]|nr:hypothetical protein X947_3063 [Burkholderia pseudomallei MSHR7334]
MPPHIAARPFTHAFARAPTGHPPAREPAGPPPAPLSAPLRIRRFFPPLPARTFLRYDGSKPRGRAAAAGIARCAASARAPPADTDAP